VTDGPFPPLALLVTGNVHKAVEIATILRGRYDVRAHAVEVDETGATFEENAVLKARAVTPGPDVTVVLSDDSGIAVDALDGAPGVRSARWTEEADWIPRLLRQLHGVPPDARTARFVCAAAAVLPDGREVVARSEVLGRVADAPRGDGGFGYDPVFIPDEGDGRTFAEAPELKARLSHRARAFQTLAAELTLLDRWSPG
jgi:XTP/dITP diphosphohydrolase